jgi:predicted CXXCH cytochrome family protein
MRTSRAFAFAFALASAVGISFPCSGATTTSGTDAECLRCHSALTQKKVVHGAVSIGCASCHPGMDAASPHQSKGRFPKGLAKDAVAVCIDCHEQALYEGKVVHAPVATGTCILCHDPHASDHLGLLRKPPVAQCLECHAEVAKAPHVVAGFSRAGHPLGETAPGRAPKEDPLRPGRPFYCVSCHEPHRSALPRLMKSRNGMASCQACHRI